MPNPIDPSSIPGALPAASPFRIAIDETLHTGARIKVIGVGGGGGNAINRMVREGFTGVELIVANTDVQALRVNTAPVKIQLGEKLTYGRGAGADPVVGRKAALEDTEKLIETIGCADMVFVTAGLGGGTGTGGAPVIANLASELGALTIAVVTRPFAFEGRKRAVQAEQGLEALRACVDSVITIPNERLIGVIDRKTSLLDAFAAVDDILRQAIQGISDLILKPGLINLDFADVKTIMTGAGVAVMGTGIGRGQNRAVDAAKKAISSPLLEDGSIDGARGVIINVTGGPDLSLAEVNDASTIICEAAHEEAEIIFGAVIDPEYEDDVKITVIATGFDRADARGMWPGRAARTPVDLSSYSTWLGGASSAGPLAVSRRHGVGVEPSAPPLPSPLAITMDASTAQAAAEPAAGEDSSGLEVPAFMRRVGHA